MAQMNVVPGIDLAGALNAARFAEQMRATREQRELKAQQMQAEQQAAARKQQALQQAATGNFDALMRLDPKLALDVQREQFDLQQDQAMAPIKITKAQLETQKAGSDAASAAIEGTVRNNKIASNLARAYMAGNLPYEQAKGRIEALTGARLPDEPPPPNAAAGLIQQLEAFNSEAPKITNDLRLYAESTGKDPRNILGNPEEAQQFRRWNQRRKERVARAGATTINNNPARERGDLSEQEMRDVRTNILDAQDTLGSLSSMRELATNNQDLFTIWAQAGGALGNFASRAGIELDQATRERLREQQRLITRAGIQTLERGKQLLGALSEGERAQIQKVLSDPESSSYEQFMGAMDTMETLAREQLRRNTRRQRTGNTEAIPADEPGRGQPRRRGGQAGAGAHIDSSQMDRARARARELAQQGMDKTGIAEVIQREFGGGG